VCTERGKDTARRAISNDTSVRFKCCDVLLCIGTCFKACHKGEKFGKTKFRVPGAGKSVMFEVFQLEVPPPEYQNSCLKSETISVICETYRLCYIKIAGIPMNRLDTPRF